MIHLQRRIALLKQPAFFAYMLSCLFAALGNGLGYIAISWAVVTVNSNVSTMAILLSCFWLPNVLLGPFMGVLADRLSRKAIITTTTFIRALILMSFSIYLTYHFNASLIYLMMLCNGIAFSAYFACIFAFMRELVLPDDLMYANATVDIVYEVGNVIGMGLAGLLIAFTSVETVIFINGITFLIATIAMFAIPKKALQNNKEQKRKEIKLLSDFKDGLQYLRNRKPLKIIYTIQLLILVTFLTTPLLLLPFSKTVLHTTVEQFGLIEAFASSGIIIGGLFMPWLSDRYGLMPTLLFFSIILCLTFAVFGYNHIIMIAMILYFIIGFSGAIWPLIISKAQSLTDLDYQGRVQSTFNALSGLIMLSFYFSIGLISKIFSVHALYWVEFGITLLAVIFLMQSKKSVDYA